MNNYTQYTDAELVTMYATGNNEAFDCLLLRHKDRLYSYILLTVKNDTVADDIFQETFVKAIMTIRQNGYRESGKFGAWLMRIAHNLIGDYYRRANQENIISNDDFDNEALPSHKLSDMAEANDGYSEDILQQARQLMERLPEEQREVVFMRIYQDLTFKEIAEATGVSINTALGRMRYATINMRRMANEMNLF